MNLVQTCSAAGGQVAEPLYSSILDQRVLHK